MTESEPKHLIVASDIKSGHQALYVGGDIHTSDSAIYGCDIADASDSKPVCVTFVEVTLPDDMHCFPKQFDSLLKYVEKDEPIAETDNGDYHPILSI